MLSRRRQQGIDDCVATAASEPTFDQSPALGLGVAVSALRVDGEKAAAVEIGGDLRGRISPVDLIWLRTNAKPNDNRDGPVCDGIDVERWCGPGAAAPRAGRQGRAALVLLR